MLKDRLDADIKQALLSGDKVTATILRGLKSAILYEEVKVGKKDSGLSDDDIIVVLAREQKKRLEAIALYEQASDKTREATERNEVEVISRYLPAQLSEDELAKLVAEEITAQNAKTIADMGKVIAAVRSRSAGAADGALIAKLVKEALAKA